MSAYMTWTDALQGFTQYLRAAGRPDSTIDLRMYHLKRLARLTDTQGPGEVTLEHLLAFMAARDWAPTTRHSYRCSMRVFFAWAHERGVIDQDPSRGLPGVKLPPPNPRPVPEDDYAAALQGASERDRLMLRLAAEAGLRRGEIALVHSRDLVKSYDGWTLIVHGKGAKTRRVPLKDSLARELRAQPPGYVFPGGQDGHVSSWWVGRIVSRRLPDEYSTHKLRHRFATRAYRVNKDLFAVQEILGHSSADTTRAYVLIAEDAKRHIVNAV